jgi:hypothetical protein
MEPIKADITVFYKKGREGKWRPYVMHLYRVRTQDEPGNARRALGK